jgi:hypothetical protein
MTVAKLIIELAKNGSAIPRNCATTLSHSAREDYKGPLHGLLNLLFHELLHSLHCLKATAVAFVEGHRS